MANLRITTFADFDFRKLKKQVKTIMKESISDIGDDAVVQLKKNITEQTYFKDKPIKNSTKAVRELRGRQGDDPLQDTGKLLKSIKKVKKGISIAAYGARHHDGYTIKPNNKDGSFGFYAPNKRAKHKRLVKFKGTALKVPARPWIVYNIDKKTFNSIYKRILKTLGVKRRRLSTKTTSL